MQVNSLQLNIYIYIYIYIFYIGVYNFTLFKKIYIWFNATLDELQPLCSLWQKPFYIHITGTEQKLTSDLHLSHKKNRKIYTLLPCGKSVESLQ